MRYLPILMFKCITLRLLEKENLLGCWSIRSCVSDTLYLYFDVLRSILNVAVYCSIQSKVKIVKVKLFLNLLDCWPSTRRWCSRASWWCRSCCCRGREPRLGLPWLAEKHTNKNKNNTPQEKSNKHWKRFCWKNSFTPLWKAAGIFFLCRFDW